MVLHSSCVLPVLQPFTLFDKQRHKNHLKVKESSSSLNSRQKIWGFSPLWISLSNYPSRLQEKGLLVSCAGLPFLKTHTVSCTAHVARISGWELPVLWDLGEHMATSFPESQSRSSCVGLERGEVEPFCSLQRVPSPLPLPAEHPVHRRPVLRVLLRGVEEAGCARWPRDQPQLLFGVARDENAGKESEHQCHGPALLLSFLKRWGKNQ